MQSRAGRAARRGRGFILRRCVMVILGPGRLKWATSSPHRDRDHCTLARAAEDAADEAAADTGVSDETARSSQGRSTGAKQSEAKAAKVAQPKKWTGPHGEWAHCARSLAYRHQNPNPNRLSLQFTVLNKQPTDTNTLQ